VTRAHSLVFSADELSRLRIELLADAPWESAAFLLARPVATPGGVWRLLVYHTIGVARDEYSARSDVAVQLPPKVVARVMQRARRERASVIFVHTHPADGPERPSSTDLAGERLLVPAFARHIPGMPHARLILGTTLTHAALFPPSLGKDDLFAIEAPMGENESTDCGTTPWSVALATSPTAQRLDVFEIGRDVHIHRAVENVEDDDTSSREPSSDTFDRQVRAFGATGQERLHTLRVAVIGVGGTGSVVVEQLAHLGVHDLLLIDPDVIEQSNLNRVVGAVPSDVGRPKVDVASAHAKRIQPGARIERVRADIRDRAVARRLLDVDFFFGCTDSQGSRAVMSQLAYQYLIPGIDMGVAIHAQNGKISHVSGRVQMLAPSLSCLICSNALESEAVRRDLLTEEARAVDPYVVGERVPQPAVVSINSTASALGVTMFLSAVVGIPVAARHQRLRLETGIVSSVVTPPAAGCPWCSSDGALGRGDTWPMPGRGDEVGLPSAVTILDTTCDDATESATGARP
jgi:molybdopterin-synthase adenylyltransferase